MRRNTKVMIIVYIIMFTTWIPASYIWANLWNKYYWSFLIAGVSFFFILTFVSLNLFGNRATYKRKLIRDWKRLNFEPANYYKEMLEKRKDV